MPTLGRACVGTLARQDLPDGCRHFTCPSCWGRWNALQEVGGSSTKCPSCNLIIVERHGATPGAQTVLYNPTSQDAG